ncbi:hypothetical protein CAUPRSCDRAFT_12583 [Caulochytrium protostelioides]|nr:hypothetical protein CAUPRSCDRAFT_12583 [Caulochytrium protostelioides]
MSVKELISTKLADLAKQDPSVHRGVCLFFDWQQAGALPFDSGAGNEYRSLVEINAMIWIWRVQRFVQQKITSMISSFKPTSLPKQPTDSDEGPDLTRDELLVKYYRWIQKNRNVEQFSEYFRVMEDFLVVLQEQLFEDANQRGQHESNGNPWAASITESDQGTEALSLRLDRLLFRARENRKQLFQYMVLRFSETRLVPVDREQAKFKGEHHTEILVAPKSEHSSLMANVDKVFKGLKFPAAQREAIEVLLPF